MHAGSQGSTQSVTEKHTHRSSCTARNKILKAVHALLHGRVRALERSSTLHGDEDCRDSPGRLAVVGALQGCDPARISPERSIEYNVCDRRRASFPIEYIDATDRYHSGEPAVRSKWAHSPHKIHAKRGFTHTVLVHIVLTSRDWEGGLPAPSPNNCWISRGRLNRSHRRRGGHEASKSAFHAFNTGHPHHP